MIYTVRKERKYRKDGAFYVISPFALTWDSENYYLVGYDSEAGIIKHYRVDIAPSARSPSCSAR